MLVLLCIALAPDAAKSQRPIMFGVCGGVNLGTLSFDSSVGGGSITSHAGLAAGLKLDVPLFDTGRFGDLSLSGQLLYVQKGVDLGGSFSFADLGFGFSASINEKWALDYLEIPVLANYAFVTGSAVRPYVFVGPSFGKLLSGKVRLQSTATATDSGITVSRSMDTSINIPDSLMKSFQVSLVFGGGLSYQLPSRATIFLEVAAVSGLTQVFTGAGSPSSKSSETRIVAGIMFPFDLGGSRRSP